MTRPTTPLKLLAVGPVILLLIGGFLVPLLYLLRISAVANRNDAASAGFGGAYAFVQYSNLLTDSFFLGMLWTSLQVGIFSALATLAIAYPVAWYLAASRGWERTILSTICLTPMFLSIVVSVFGWNVLLLPFGVLQQNLVALGFADDPLVWPRSIAGLVLIFAYEFFPFCVLILVASIQAIRPDKIQAARLLGASPLRIFLTIAAPLSMPGIAGALVLAFSLAISSYLVPTLVSGHHVLVLPMQIFSTIAEVMDWPAAAAMSVLLLLLVFASTFGIGLLAARLVRRGSWSLV